MDKFYEVHGSGSNVSKSLAATGKLTQTQNPYTLYDSVVSDSIDDGIHTDLTNGGDRLGDTVHSQDGPSEDMVLREFTDYMDAVSPLSEPEDIALRSTSTGEKWTLLLNQQNRSPVFIVRYYIENLKQNQGTRRKRFSIGKASKHSSGGLGYVLRKLKLDIKMSPSSFLLDFLKDPNCGLHLLVQVLKEIQRDKDVMNTARKTKKDEMEKSLEDEEDCLLCLKFLLRIEEGVKRMADEEGVCDLVAQSMLSSKARCRAIALKILSIITATSAHGYRLVMDAMDRQKRRLNEDFKFRTLCNILNMKGVHFYPPFLTSSMAFINRLITGASNAGARVHLQYELHMAGFRPDDMEIYSRGSTFEHDDLSIELEKWKHNFIDVTNMKDENTTLESRNMMLREEVSRMEQQQRVLENSTKQLEREKRKTEEKADEYRERAAELQDTVEKLRMMYRESAGRVTDRELNVDEVLKPLDLPADSNAARFASVRSLSSISTDVPEPTEQYPSLEAPPLPPPAPPLMVPAKRNVPTANVELPFLNWSPLKRVDNTIFQDIDEGVVYRELDLVDFENRFQLMRRPQTKETRGKRERITQHHGNRLVFVEMDRAKNLSITKYKTGMTSRQIKDAIEACDPDKLPGEYAELFIKFIPTKDEIKKLSKHKDEYGIMGEAEQFLFQMAQVERLESKLSILAFLGIFNELVNSLKPNIWKVLEASNAVLSNQGLKKIFEIILAFGNYMNSGKRGYVMGFRLESLNKVNDVKSTNRHMTLMHYIVDHVKRHYPEYINFYDDFNLTIDKTASYHAMGQDVVWLRKGTDLVKFEKEKQKSNHSLEQFFVSASIQVAEIAENFKKMEEAYRDVCLMMGENYKNIEPSCFFGILAEFFNNFKVAAEEMSRRPELQRPITLSKTVQCGDNVKRKAQLPHAKVKEAPKILAPLAPVVTSSARTVQSTKSDIPKGPITAQHKMQYPYNQDHLSTKKKAAPEPPPDYNDNKSQLDSKGMSRVNGHGIAVGEGTQTVDGSPRDRTESEAYQAQVSDALAELNMVLDLEEQMAGQEEDDTLCSRL